MSEAVAWEEKICVDEQQEIIGRTNTTTKRDYHSIVVQVLT